MQSSSSRGVVLFALLTTAGCADTTHYGSGYQRSSLASKKADAGAATTAALTSKDPFDGAPPFASLLPDARATTNHANGKVSVVPGKDTKCLGCHGTMGDEAAAPKFIFGGSVFEDKAATISAKDMELGLIDSAGNTVRVHSDQDGNFWALGTPKLTYPAYASIRTADMKKAMKKKINDESELECASCHDGSNRIVKP